MILSKSMMKRIKMQTMRNAKASIFAELQAILPTCKIYNVASGAELDATYLALYGDRYTYDTFDSGATAQAVKVMYADNWDRAYDLFLASGNLMIDLGNQSTTTTTKDYGYTDTVSTNDSVPAFDVDTPQLDKQTDRELTHTVNNDTETVKSDSKDINRFGTAYNYLQKQLINDIVFADINKLATISIHLTGD